MHNILQGRKSELTCARHSRAEQSRQVVYRKQKRQAAGGAVVKEGPWRPLSQKRERERRGRNEREGGGRTEWASWSTLLASQHCYHGLIHAARLIYIPANQARTGTKGKGEGAVSVCARASLPTALFFLFWIPALSNLTVSCLVLTGFWLGLVLAYPGLGLLFNVHAIERED